jgi:hypothetical protein
MRPCNCFVEVISTLKADCRPSNGRLAHKNWGRRGGPLNAKKAVWSAFMPVRGRHTGPRLLILTYYNFLRSLR